MCLLGSIIISAVSPFIQNTVTIFTLIISGTGLSLLVDLLRLTDPCHVVQIDSDQNTRNIPQPLSDEFILDTPGWITDEDTRYLLFKILFCCKKVYSLQKNSVDNFSDLMHFLNIYLASSLQIMGSWFLKVWRPLWYPLRKPSNPYDSQVIRQNRICHFNV